MFATHPPMTASFGLLKPVEGLFSIHLFMVGVTVDTSQVEEVWFLAESEDGTERYLISEDARTAILFFGESFGEVCAALWY